MLWRALIVVVAATLAVGAALDVVAPAAAAAAASSMPPPQRFIGSGCSSCRVFPHNETTVFEETLNVGDVGGYMNHYWSTGLGQSLYVRYYIDDEPVASIQFTPAMACGVGWNHQRIRAPYGTRWAGKGATQGGWYHNYRIPFRKRIRITVQNGVTVPVAGMGLFWLIVRGVVNAPLHVANVNVPPHARMRLHKVATTVAPLTVVDVLRVPRGRAGLVFQHTLAVHSGNLNFLEGCYHAYPSVSTSSDDDGAVAGVAPPTVVGGAHRQRRQSRQHWPRQQQQQQQQQRQRPRGGILLSTGTEDYFDSAFYFNAGMYQLPVSGLTVLTNATTPVPPAPTPTSKVTMATSSSSSSSSSSHSDSDSDSGSSKTTDGLLFSAYRFHDMDTLPFHDGLRVTWRNGDTADPVTGVKCMSPNGKVVGSPTTSDVRMYTWVYEWDTATA